MKIDRLLAITIALLNDKKVTAKALAEHHEVSVRTIYRDIETLNQAGIPVYSEQGKTGGFRILEDYTLDKRLLSPQDGLAVLTALKGMSRAFDDKALKDTMNKFKGMVEVQEEEDLVLDILPWGTTKKDVERIRQVREAISSHRVTELEYVNNNGEHSVRLVEPMSLVYKGVSWYLFAWCRLKQGFRIFKISRMIRFEQGDDLFIRRKELYSDVFATEQEYKGKRLHLKVRYHHSVRFRALEYSTTWKEVEEGCILAEHIFPDDSWVMDYILSFGRYAEVLEPVSFREELRAHALALLEHYQ